MKKFLTVIALMGMVLFAAAPLAIAQNCDAQTTKAALECGTTNASGAPVSASPENSINDSINSAIKYLSYAVGIAATVMLVVGSFKYITSGGEASKVESGKKTIIYALIGLVIVALAQVIVQFVLTQTTNPSTPTPTVNSNNNAGGTNCASDPTHPC